MGRNFLIKRVFPIHALGDRLDQQIYFCQPMQIIIKISNFDQSRLIIVS